MAAKRSDPRPLTRGHKKRERTREQLLAAAMQVLAEKGEALTVSDVVTRAEVSNGTFYNYFSDRDELIDALAEHSLIRLAARSAVETVEHDPARRFAIATGRVLRRAEQDPDWGRAVLRLADHRRSLDHAVGRYLEEDLAEGFAQQRFALAPDAITRDLLVGLIIMTIRRIVRGEAPEDHVVRVLVRALTILGLADADATALAREATSERLDPETA
jgi:AcrR family transcriptional regulator